MLMRCRSCRMAASPKQIHIFWAFLFKSSNIRASLSFVFHVFFHIFFCGFPMVFDDEPMVFQCVFHVFFHGFLWFFNGFQWFLMVFDDVWPWIPSQTYHPSAAPRCSKVWRPSLAPGICWICRRRWHRVRAQVFGGFSVAPLETTKVNRC